MVIKFVKQIQVMHNLEKAFDKASSITMHSRVAISVSFEHHVSNRAICFHLANVSKEKSGHFDHNGNMQNNKSGYLSK